jgi:hypothetical protein
MTAERELTDAERAQEPTFLERRLVEALTKRLARQIQRDGHRVWTHDGDEDVRAAFDALGWDDFRPVG